MSLSICSRVRIASRDEVARSSVGQGLRNVAAQEEDKRAYRELMRTVRLGFVQGRIFRVVARVGSCKSMCIRLSCAVVCACVFSVWLCYLRRA